MSIRAVAPDRPVILGDEVRIIIRATEGNKPLPDREVTFEVVSGPGSFPGGFESATTDAEGVATALTLQPKEGGEVVVRVAIGTDRVDVTVTVAGRAAAMLAPGGSGSSAHAGLG